MSNFFSSKYGCQPCRPQRFRGCLPQRWEGHPIKSCQMSRRALLLLCGQTSNVWVCIAVTLWPDFKCLGVHCCYSMARLQMSGCALLLLCGQTSNFWACIAVTLQPDFKCLSRHALHLLRGQTHWSPSKY